MRDSARWLDEYLTYERRQALISLEDQLPDISFSGSLDKSESDLIYRESGHPEGPRVLEVLEAMIEAAETLAQSD